jgi:hypothetical protein
MKYLTLLILFGTFGVDIVQGQQLFLEPTVLAGVTNGGSDVGFVGLGFKSRVVVSSIAVTAGYRWVHTAIACQTSLPPICNSPTPAGHLFLFGISKVVAGGSRLSAAIGLEGGFGRFLNWAETDRDTWPLAGISTGFKLYAGSTAINVDGVIDWTRRISFIGGRLGVAIPM